MRPKMIHSMPATKELTRQSGQNQNGYGQWQKVNPGEIGRDLLPSQPD
jgi:hypothetical protein